MNLSENYSEGSLERLRGNKMTKQTHTPGPWEYLPLNKCIRSKSSAISEHSLRFVCDLSQDEEKEISEANARLIASAPELLEACKFAYDYLHINPSRKVISDKLKQAIAKAEGVE